MPMPPISSASGGTAFIARPLGSIVFGHYGDRLGRKVTLVGALLTMGIATFLIGLLPTIHQIGLWAPAMLTILRFFQGIGLGGEWSGAALLATETAAPGKRAWAAMWPQLGAPFGFFLANGTFLVIMQLMDFDSKTSTSNHAFMTWGWRIPFLASAVMVIVGLYVRLKLTETPVFAKAVQDGKKVKAPLGEVLRTAWRPLIIGTFVMVATYTLFYLVTTWIVSYGTGKVVDRSGIKLGISYIDFLEMQLIAVLFFAAFVAVSARIASTRLHVGEESHPVAWIAFALSAVFLVVVLAWRRPPQLLLVLALSEPVLRRAGTGAAEIPSSAAAAAR